MDDKLVTKENNTSQGNVSTPHVAPETDGVSEKNSTIQAGSSVESSELSKVYEIAGLISSALGNDKVLNVGMRDGAIIPDNNMPVKDNQNASESVLETSDYIPVYEKEDTDVTDKNTSVVTNDLGKEKDDVSQYGCNIEEEDENTNFYDMEGEEADENIKLQSSHEPSVNEEMISNSEQSTKDFVGNESADTFVLSSSSFDEEVKEKQRDEYTTDDHGILPTPVKTEEIPVCKIPEPIVKEEQDEDSAILKKKVPSKLIISAVIVCNRPELLKHKQDIYKTSEYNTPSEASLGEDVTDSQMHGSISQEGCEDDTPSMEKEPDEQMVTDNTSEATMNEEREQEGEIDYNTSLIAQLDEAKLAAVSIRELCKSMQLDMQEKAEHHEMGERADLQEMEERAEFLEMGERVELPEMEERVELPEMDERVELPEMEERVELPEMEERVELPEMEERVELPEMKERVELPEMEERVELPEVEERVELPEMEERVELPEVEERAEFYEMEEKAELQEMELQAPDIISVEEETKSTDEKIENEVTLTEEAKVETLVKEMEHIGAEVPIQEPSIVQEVAAEEPSLSSDTATNDEPSQQVPLAEVFELSTVWNAVQKRAPASTRERTTYPDTTKTTNYGLTPIVAVAQNDNRRGRTI